jgi:hypothetical protein
MNLLNVLKETEESKKIRKWTTQKNELVIRDFQNIEFGDFLLSIRADATSNCTPRKTLDEINKYETMEFALVKGEKFLSVTDVLPEFSKLKEIQRYDHSIYGYVPVELIQDLYLELSKKYQ